MGRSQGTIRLRRNVIEREIYLYMTAIMLGRAFGNCRLCRLKTFLQTRQRSMTKKDQRKFPCPLQFAPCCIPRGHMDDQCSSEVPPPLCRFIDEGLQPGKTWAG